MRSGWLVAAALLVSLAPVNAQELPNILTGTDKAADVQLFLPDGTQHAAGSQFGHLDIISALVEKATPDEMRFALGLTDPQAMWAPPYDTVEMGITAELHFTFGGVHYFVDFGEPNQAMLRRFVSEQKSDPIADFPATIEGSVVSALIPRTVVTDLNGAALRHPAQLTDVHAQTYEFLFNAGTGPATARDHGPDAGSWGGLLTPVDPGAGPLLLTPRQTMRGSNGGTGVLLFEILADNIGDQTIEVLLQIDDLPQAWSAKVPARIQLDPGESRVIPVLVTTPFGHEHGTTQNFNLQAEVLGQQTLHQSLGVFFFEVPQPAGHHPNLYMHSATVPSNGIRVWLDTLAENPEDERVADGPWGTVTNLAQQTETAFYLTPLAQDLHIGLDFDMTRTMQARFGLQADLAEQVHLSARLEHCNPSDLTGRDYGEYGGDNRCPGTWIPLAQHDDDVTLAAGANAIDWSLSLTDYADLVHQQPQAMLAFVMEIQRSITVTGLDLIVDGTQFDLPLHEYQPPLTGTLSDIGALTFPHAPAQRYAGPGSRLVYMVDLTNQGGQPLDVAFDAIGHNAAWIQLPRGITMAPGTTSGITFDVTIPSDALTGHYMQAYLLATASGHDELVAITPILIEITDAPATTDPSAAQPTPQQASALPLVATLAALVLVGRRRPH